MRQLVSVFVDIAFHRKGPDAVPASGFLFGLVLLGYGAVSLPIWILNWSAQQAIGILFLDVVLHLSFFGAVLAIAHRSRRFLQTITAALGAETFLGCFALPLHLTIVGDRVDGPALAATFLLLLILFWSIDIAGFVLSRALDRPYIVGVVIMIGYVFGSMTLGEFLFPSPR